jgi:hypothetical protein
VSSTNSFVGEFFFFFCLTVTGPGVGLVEKDGVEASEKTEPEAVIFSDFATVRLDDESLGAGDNFAAVMGWRLDAKVSPLVVWTESARLRGAGGSGINVKLRQWRQLFSMP